MKTFIISLKKLYLKIFLYYALLKFSCNVPLTHFYIKCAQFRRLNTEHLKI